MSRFIAASAIRGSHYVVDKADKMLKDALEKFGPDKSIAFVDKEGAGSAYYLPVIYGYLGHKIEKLGDMPPILEHCKKLLSPVPDEHLWLPYLGETADAGVITLFAEELIKGIEFAEGKQPEVRNGYQFNGPISDPQTRSWGIQMVDGSMPGFAAVIGAAKSNEVAVKLIRELQSKGQLIFLSSMSNGRSTVNQLLEEGVELGYGTFTVPFGTDTESVVYAAGYATRAAFSFGNVAPGDWRKMLLYNKFRCFAFALCLGPMDDLKWATGAGAITYGFPAILDTVTPNILPIGITKYEHVVSMPFDDIPGRDDLERAERLIEKCVEVRGIKIVIPKVPIPVAFGPAFEGEVVRRADLQAEFGRAPISCFEWLTMKGLDEIDDHKITLVGPDLDEIEVGTNNPLGIFVEVAGRKMQKDFEAVLERQIHHFMNGAEGCQHQGQRDISWTRISKKAFNSGFRLKDIGEILHTNFHNQFGAIVDKVQITLYTNLEDVERLREQAREVYRERNERIAGLTDDAVDTYYSCVLCQSFAPTHVCVINPERVGLCGAYSWLDCRAAFEINPTGPNQPVPKGRLIDPVKGEWEGVNQFVFEHSGGNVDRFTIYSLMDAPMTTCGCCECVMIVIPEANGVMVVSREDLSMTPSGMTFTTLMASVGGGQQNPGMMGHGKIYMLSDKFISVEGGLRRVVWLSKNLKGEYGEEINARVEREHDIPNFLDMVADGDVATTVDELLPFLEEKGHPALSMESII
jgi:acetyl-CoA synthase